MEAKHHCHHRAFVIAMQLLLIAAGLPLSLSSLSQTSLQNLTDSFDAPVRG
jgi:hypothetical protein